jgi:integrase/recombinase XerD
MEPTSAHIDERSPLAPTIQLWRVYLEDQGNSIHTVKAFSHDLNLLAGYLPLDRSIGAITTQDLQLFLEWLQHGRGVPCSPKTLSRRITALKSFFHWLQQYGALTVDPAEKLVQKTVISPLAQVLTPDEVARVREVAADLRRGAKPDARPWLLLDLLLTTAIKKGETVGIQLNHLELEDPEEPTLFVRYASPSYRFKERKIPLSPEWPAALAEYRAQYEISEQLFPWSQRRLEYLLEDLGQAAGLEKHLSFDMCRWTSALTDWQNGVDPTAIRQKLGISKIQWREVSAKLRRLAEEAAPA